MARHSKNVVDYFPHNVHSGKTLFILENKYGNDGYAFWFKILEMLGSNDNHYIDCRNAQVWEFMLAKTRVTDETANNILLTLANLNAINSELWDNKIIYSDNFINNIADAYKRRNSKCMQFDDLCKHLTLKCKHKSLKSEVNVDKKPQSKVKESKVKDSKGFTAPTLEEVKEYFKTNQFPEHLAVKAFNHYDVAGWKDSKGNPVKNWKQKMNSVWFDEEKKIKEPAVPKKITMDDYNRMFGGEGAVS